jgi:tellurite resistance protein TerC
MNESVWFWIGFNAFVVLMLALDLGVFHRRAHAISVREAAIWSGVWVALSLLFALGLDLFVGGRPALAFLTGYVVEKSLSVDNLFVFVTIFSYFRVPLEYQHRVLFWGIIGAAVLRGAFVAAGAYLLSHFEWVMYIFGALLVLTAIRMVRKEDRPFEAEENRLVNLFRRLIPVTNEYHGKNFFTRVDGRIMATPLLLVLVLIEASDILFAVDSIPAIFAVTRDPFLVYTATMFAVLGLRAMYFLLAAVVERFRYLHYGLAFILLFIGVKMLIAEVYEVPIWLSLLVILVVLAISVIVSLRLTEDEPPHPPPGAPPDPQRGTTPGADVARAVEPPVSPGRAAGGARDERAQV